MVGAKITFLEATNRIAVLFCFLTANKNLTFDLFY